MTGLIILFLMITALLSKNRLIVHIICLLKKYNINLNLAPCVDIKTTEKSSVGKNERTYGNNYKQVNIYAKEFVKAHYDNGVIPVLKHFPGIGNAELDTHKGLPDISSTWT